MIATSRKCRICGAEKPLLYENFRPNASCFDGFVRTCRLCANEKLRDKYWENPDASRAKCKSIEDRHRQKKNKKIRDAYAESVLSERKDKRVRSRYKMTIHEYNDRLAAQNGVCEICKQPSEKMCIDHNHACCPTHRSCGECVRGIICGKCNYTLGMADDNPITMRAMADYIERYPLHSAHLPSTDAPEEKQDSPDDYTF